MWELYDVSNHEKGLISLREMEEHLAKRMQFSSPLASSGRDEAKRLAAVLKKKKVSALAKDQMEVDPTK